LEPSVTPAVKRYHRLLPPARLEHATLHYGRQNTLSKQCIILHENVRKYAAWRISNPLGKWMIVQATARSRNEDPATSSAVGCATAFLIQNGIRYGLQRDAVRICFWSNRARFPYAAPLRMSRSH
jgi:hypothetical protein